jgi:flavin reductase (DIM6/NTAB) family NADH-FMN oxidoreductase RutF
MPIEVRQLSIRASVGEPGSGASSSEETLTTPEQLQELRAELLAECKAWLEERLQQMRER